MVALKFREEEGAFLVGALAALRVAERTPSASSAAWTSRSSTSSRPAIAPGAQDVCPQCRVLVGYAGVTGDAFKNPAKGKELALAQYGAGADIIFHAAGTTGLGVFEAARETGRYAIGVDADQWNEAPGHILTSMTKQVDVAVFETVRGVRDGRWQGGVLQFGLKRGRRRLRLRRAQPRAHRRRRARARRGAAADDHRRQDPGARPMSRTTQRCAAGRGDRLLAPVEALRRRGRQPRRLALGHARRGARGHRRERRRQVDADARALRPRCRPTPARCASAARSIARPSVAEAIARKVGMVHQHFMLVPTLTVGRERGARPRAAHAGRSSTSARAEREIAALSARFGLRRRAAAAGVVAVGGRGAARGDRQGAVARRRGAHPRRADRGADAARGGRAVRGAARARRRGQDRHPRHPQARRGAGARRCASRCCGAARWSARPRTAAPAHRRRELARAMVGRDLAAAPPRPAARSSRRGARAAARRAADASRAPTAARALDDVSLSVRGGEILGVAGVEGNGQSELALAIAGVVPARTSVRGGRILVDGRDVTRAGVRARRGLGRRRTCPRIATRAASSSSSPSPTTSSSAARSSCGALACAGSTTRRIVERLDVRPPDGRARDVVAVGRQPAEGRGRPRARRASLAVLVCAQPTRGVDVGAIERIHAELAHARVAGTAVLLLSADLDELLALSDRIVVLYRGRVAGCVDNLPERRAEVRSEVASLMLGAGRVSDGPPLGSRSMRRSHAHAAAAAVGHLDRARRPRRCSSSPSVARRWPSIACSSPAPGATATASARCCSRRRRSSSPGLAVSLALRAGLFNIGAEGQLTVGAFVDRAGRRPRRRACPRSSPCRWRCVAGARRRRARRRHRRRAQGVARRARGHQHHHAQLHRARGDGRASARTLFEREPIHTAPIAAAARAAAPEPLDPGAARLGGQRVAARSRVAVALVGLVAARAHARRLPPARRRRIARRRGDQRHLGAAACSCWRMALVGRASPAWSAPTSSSATSTTTRTASPAASATWASPWRCSAARARSASSPRRCSSARCRRARWRSTRWCPRRSSTCCRR